MRDGWINKCMMNEVDMWIYGLMNVLVDEWMIGWMYGLKYTDSIDEQTEKITVLKLSFNSN